MKKIYFSVLMFGLSLFGFGQDSISALFIGNSYTQYNNLPQIIEDIVVSKGDILNWDSRLQGGAKFITHANNAATYEKINNNPWDFVIIQGQSQEPSFPVEQVNTESYPYAKQIADSVYDNNACSQVQFYMTWGRENGDPQWDSISTFEKMNNRLRNAYKRFADSIKGSVSPIGTAWKYVRDNNPTINLYASDGSHPSYAGSYLAACTFYASLYRKTPVGTSFIGSLDQETATILQEAAAISVLDSLQTWKLRENQTFADFSLTQNGGEVSVINTSWYSNSHTFDFGDAFTSTENELTHTYLVTDNYSVQLEAVGDCGTDTYSLLADVLAGLDKNNLRYTLKNFGAGKYELNYPVQNVNYLIYDTSGKVVFNGSFLNAKKIDLSKEPTGVYFMKFENGLEIKLLR